jgi:transposase-like protein
MEAKMLNCPRCASADKVKSGINKGLQRYKCKTCQYFFTVSHKSDTATPDQRRLALNLYLEGLGFRSIGRILGFSHVAVYQWVKAFGETVEQIKRPAAQIVELDELHSYVGHKKTTAGSGLLLIDLANASSMLSLAHEAS